MVTGASKTAQLQNNLGAVAPVAALASEVKARIDEIMLPLAD